MQDILTAICDPTRRAALALLWDGGEHCVCELMARLDASQSRMSRHMKVLREAGLVLDRRDAMGRPILERLGQGASTALFPVAQARGIAVIPADLPSVHPGQSLRVEPLCE